MSEYSGHENLETATKRKNFTKWVFDVVSPALKGNILEVGSGLGTFSEHIIQRFPESLITLSDVSTTYVKNLEEKFGSSRVDAYKLDLNDSEDFRKMSHKKFDSIIAINVLEHIEDDKMALRQLRDLLNVGGTLVILVPANKFLYNVIDKSIGHWRRYTKGELRAKVKECGFGIDEMFSFNILGMVGWYINGNVCKNPVINKQASGVFDKLIPAMRVIEKLLGRKIGLSVICFARKA
ncbi:MAG: class I SAM-dependent methyltransferase [Candidatus Nitrosotenuis sp.]